MRTKVNTGRYCAILTSIMAALDQHAALIRQFFERRNIHLFEGVRRERSVIANQMAAKGLLHSGAFVGAVTAAYVSGFTEFAQGLIKDTLDLMRRSGLVIDSAAASWITEQLIPFIDAAARNVCREAGEGAVLGKELNESVERAMARSVGAIKRDLKIELDVALLTHVSPVEVVDEAMLDTLVPLQNQRGLERAFSVETGEPKEPLCIVLFDIDHFKEVNDKHGGHATGDEALLEIARTAASCTRGKGAAFRLHGDEFVLLLRNHTLHEGLAVAERFRREVNETPRTSQQLTLSVSVGVAMWPEHGKDLEAVLKAADYALYDAKNRGRNLVRYCGEPAPSAPATHEPERKEPDPGGLTAAEQLKIRQDYFRNGMALCPRDEAILNVIDVTAHQDVRNNIIITCPLCGLSANLS